MTDRAKAATGRWYDDACGMAMAMELVGERWSLLVLRELMYGPRRFGELRQGLPGISANVLTQRLDHLERSGVLVKRRLPPPASVQVYELTEWGYEGEPMLQELGRWAARSPDHDPSLPLSGASLMMSFRTMLARDRAGDAVASLGFRLGEERFVARLESGQLAVRRDEPSSCDLVFTAPSAALIAGLVYGGLPIDEAEAGGLLTIEGDRALAARFATWFPLPAKAPG